MPRIAVNLDQWADGAAPDLPVNSGSQADQWQNGNLGTSNSHYVEGNSVPYRAIISGLTAGHTYTIDINWRPHFGQNKFKMRNCRVAARESGKDRFRRISDD